MKLQVMDVYKKYVIEFSWLEIPTYLFVSRNWNPPNWTTLLLRYAFFYIDRTKQCWYAFYLDC